MRRNYSYLKNILFIEKNYPLKNISSLRSGGNAYAFAKPKSYNDLCEILETAYKLSVPISVIGSATNTLISDKPIEGLLISTESMKGITMKGDILEAYPGEMLDDVIKTSIEHKLIGIEKLSGIPGTIGGATMLNAEANGLHLSDMIYYIDYILPSGEFHRCAIYNDTFSKGGCNLPESAIIINIALRLIPSKATAEARLRSEMYTESMFIPPVPRLLGRVFKQSSSYKIEELIKEAGMTGKNGTLAEFSEYQSNCIFTYPGCTSKAVYDLIENTRDAIFNKFGIEAESQVTYLGEF